MKENKKIMLLGIGIGTLIEILEFIATKLFINPIVGDYANNAGDLVANAIGALFATSFALNHFKRNPRLQRTSFAK